MSTPKNTGSGSRMRTAGVALLALAAIAAVIGLVLAVSRAQRTAATEPAAPAPPHAPVTASPQPSVIPFPPVASSPAPATEAPPAAPPEVGGPVLGDKGDKGNGRGGVRIYNNSTIRGLAARVAGDLRAAGWTVVEIGNYAAGTIPTTTVYYQQDDAAQRADAEAIAAAFGMRIEPRFRGILDAAPGIVVIVTNDYAH